MSRTKNLPGPSRERRPSVQVRLEGIQGNVPTFGSPSTSDEVWRKHLKAAFGTASERAGMSFFNKWPMAASISS